MKTKKNKQPQTKPFIVPVINPINIIGKNPTQTKEDIRGMVRFAQSLGLKKF